MLPVHTKAIDHRQRGLPTHSLTLPARKDPGPRAAALEGGHHLHQELAVGGRHPDALVQDLLHLGRGDGADVELEEAVAEGAGQGLAAPVGAPRGVLRGEEAEGRVRADDFLLFFGGGSMLLRWVSSVCIERTMNAGG